MTQKLLALPEVIKKTTLSKPTIYRGIKAGTFPKPVRISVRRVGWLDTTIQSWLEARN